MSEPRKNYGRRKTSRGSSEVKEWSLELKLRMALKEYVALSKLDAAVSKLIPIVSNQECRISLEKIERLSRGHDYESDVSVADMIEIHRIASQPT